MFNDFKPLKMKLFVSICLLFISGVTFSQLPGDSTRKPRVPRNGYGTLTFVAGFKEGHNSVGGALNFGVKPSKHLGVGVGFELLSFNNVKTKYVPAYLDCRIFFPGSSVEAFGLIQPGYGFYSFKDDYDTTIQGVTVSSSISQKGGFYFSTGAGIKIKGALSPVFTIRYAINQFKTVLKGDHFVPPTSGSINSIVFNVGLSF